MLMDTMKFWKPLTIATFAAAVTVVMPLVTTRPASASAFELPPGAIAHEIHITARVKPVRTVIVNDQNVIIEIASNTAEAAEIQVFRGSVAAANAAALTPEIQAQFDRLVPPGSATVGVLYKQVFPLAVIQPQTAEQAEYSRRLSQAYTGTYW